MARWSGGICVWFNIAMTSDFTSVEIVLITLPQWKRLCQWWWHYQPQPGSFFQRQRSQRRERESGNKVVISHAFAVFEWHIRNYLLTYLVWAVLGNIGPQSVLRRLRCTWSVLLVHWPNVSQCDPSIQLVRVDFLLFFHRKQTNNYPEESCFDDRWQESESESIHQKCSCANSTTV